MTDFIIELIIALLFVILATLTDIKTREVPYAISNGLLISAVILRIFFSIRDMSFNPILYGLYGFLIFGLFAYILFRTNIWGGADVTILAGLGLLFGYKYGETFLLSYVINLFIVGGILGIIFCLYKGIRYRKQLKYKSLKHINIIYLTISVFLILNYFLINDLLLKLTLTMLIIFIPLSMLLLNYVKAVQNDLMDVKISVPKLTEGDWVVKDVKVDGKVIAKSKDNGLSLKQLDTLNKLYKNKKIKTVLVREGMPFLPSFLISLIVTYYIGNIFIFMLTTF